MKKTIYAPAKINLYLDVFSKNTDGYHDIKSIMQSITLTDTVSVTPVDCGISLSCTDSSLPTDEHNLAYKAAQIFFEKSRVSGGADIHIEKRIPVSSGLAGGSTDAGAVLKLLNELYGEPLDKESLLEAGTMLGADVPFCMTGGCALCTGRGEIMTPIDCKDTDITVILARGGEGVSTPHAYKKLDEHFGRKLSHDSGDVDRVIAALQNGDTSELCSSMFNIFEEVILPHHKTAAKYSHILTECGAERSMMSGSGPAVFGIFTNQAAADNAYRYLRSIDASVFLCKFCDG